MDTHIGIHNAQVDMAAGMQLFIMAGLKDNASNCKV
jgi:hypothetical protein